MRSVLYLDHHAEIIGGGQLSLLGLMGHLDPGRYLPRLACPGGGTLAAAARREGIAVDEVEMPSLRTPLAALGAVRKIRRLMAEHEVALLHANSSRSMFYAGLAGRRPTTPVIWHVRVIIPDGWWDRVLGRLAGRIVVISEAVRSRFPSKPVSAKLCLIHNGVDLQAFAAADGTSLRRQLGREAKMLVGMVAQLVPWKRHGDFLRAMALVVRRHPEVFFVIAGEDPERGGTHGLELQHLSKALGVAGNGVFLGFRQDVAAVMAMLDLVVLTSENEPFGRVLVEAMAAGKPVVATAGGGVAEIVADRQTGLLVPVGDVEAIAAAINWLLEHREEAGLMGAAGKRRAELCFSIKAHAYRVQALYDELLSR